MRFVQWQSSKLSWKEGCTCRKARTKYHPERTSLHICRGECDSIIRARRSQATLATNDLVMERARMAHNLLGNMSQLNPKREATPPAHAATEAEEPVRGKKALKSICSAQSTNGSKILARKRPLHNSRSRRRQSNPSGKLCSRRRRPWTRRGRNMLRRKSHMRAWKKFEEDEDEECMHDADKNKGRDLYQEWYNPHAHFSQSTEIQEVRTAISQNSTTLALLEKAFHPGTYTVAIETDSGRACMWRNFQLKTPHRLPAATNTSQLFRSASDRDSPY